MASSPSKRIQATIKKESMSPGRIIAGKYRYIRPLGEGGMGQVHLVCDIETNQKLAMKYCFEDHEKRFEREVHAWLRLGRHPNIVTAIYFDWVDGLPSLFIEYVDGGTLSEVIKKSREEKKDIPTEIVFDYAIQICRGMAHLHKNGIIHRDLKPSNILLAKEESGFGILKITDMGLSKFKGWGTNSDQTISLSHPSDPATLLAQSPELTQTHDMLGTPQYMSPQQYESSKEVGEETDIYAFGVILYELLSQGKRPFDAGDDYRGWLYAHTYEPPKNIKNHVTGRFSFFQRKSKNAIGDLVMQCLAKKSEDRPRSFLEIEDTLKSLYMQIFSRQYTSERYAFVSAITPGEVNNQAVSLLEMSGQYAEEGARKLEKLCQSTQDCPSATINRLLFQLKSQRITLREFWRMTEDLASQDSKERVKILQIILGTALERGSFLAQSLKLLGEARSLSWSSGLLRLHAKWRYCLGEYRKAIKLFQNICHSQFAIAEDFYHYAGAVVEQALIENQGHLIIEKNNYSLLMNEEVKQQVQRILVEGEQKCGSYVWFQEGKDRILGKSMEKAYFWHEHGILEGHTANIRAIQMTADQRKAVSAGIDGTIRIWDLHQQSELARWKHEDVQTIAIDPQGEFVVSGSKNGTIYLWHTETGKILWQNRQPCAITQLAVSGNSQIIATTNEQGTIILWDSNILSQPSLFNVFRKSKIMQLQTQSFRSIRHLVLSLDGEYILASTSNNDLLLWNTEQKKTTPTVLALQFPGDISSIALSSDNRLAVISTLSSQNNVHLWDIPKGKHLLSFTGATAPIEAMAISSSGRIVFVAQQGLLTIWDMPNKEKIALLEGHSAAINNIVAGLDASLAITSSQDGTIRIWKNSFLWPLICQQSYWKIVPEMEDRIPEVLFDD